MTNHNRGGKRTGAGRPNGARNIATTEQITTITELARAHSQTAIDTLVEIAANGNSESARVSAANALLDRGFGKVTQPPEHSGEVTQPPKDLKVEIVIVDPPVR